MHSVPFKIYLFQHYSSSNKSDRQESRRRKNHRKNLKTHKNIHSYKIKPIFRYSKMYKRTRKYRKLVEKINSVQNNQFQYFNEVSSNCILINEPKINEDDNITKKEFTKKNYILNKWYAKFPIIKSKRDHRISIRNNLNTFLYDKPTLIESNCELDVKFNILHLIDLLSCPLCKGLYYNAHTIKECMHTFCKSCLILSTLENGPVCPKCFVYFESGIKDSIEYDYNIQAMVDKVFPKFLESERKQVAKLDTMIRVLQSQNVICRTEYKQCNLINKDTEEQPCVKISDTTSEFIKKAVDGYCNLSLLFDNILSIALIHESDNEFSELCKEMKYNMQRRNENNNKENNNDDKHLEDNEKDNKENKVEKQNKKYPRRFICVPKTIYLSHLIAYLIKELVLDPKYSIVFTMSNSILSKYQTLEYICKSLKIDMSKCVIFRYKITQNVHNIQM